MEKRFDLDDCMAFVTSNSAKVFAQAMEKRLRPYFVSRSQWIAMHYISSRKGLTQKELARLMSVKEPSIVRMIQKMEAEGYLIRADSDTDRRVKCLVLTEHGEQVYHKILPVVERFKNDTTEGIPEEDLLLLRKTLEKMVDNASKKG